MATKQSKLSQIQNQSSNKSVFGSNMFSGMGSASIQANENDYTYITVELSNIIFNEVEYPEFLYTSIKTERLVSPVILSYDYKNAKRGGVTYREKTGKYNIVSGNKRISVYSRLLKEAMQDENDEGIKTYASIPALVLPLAVSDEEIAKIKEVNNQDKGDGTKNIIEDITETKNHAITYCYKYEAAEIDVNKLTERDNKYLILQSEVDELEKSIYHAGLMQPIIVLPFIDQKTMDVRYEIQAGHKRKKAIYQLIEHAKLGHYPNSELILSAYKTVSALIIPMGATAEQIEKVYNDTNILSRHMSTDDVFRHINYFEDLPTRPLNKVEYIAFKENKYRMSALANMLQNKFKNLGFADWQNRKSKIFLNIYYYGSDKCLDVFTNINQYDITQKELEWIATTYKDFNERKKQDEILEKALTNKNYLLSLQNKQTIKRTPQKIKLRKLTENIIKQKSGIEKLSVTPIDLKNADLNDLENAKKVIRELSENLKEIMERLDDIKNDDFIQSK